MTHAKLVKRAVRNAMRLKMYTLKRGSSANQRYFVSKKGIRNALRSRARTSSRTMTRTKQRNEAIRSQSHYSKSFTYVGKGKRTVWSKLANEQAENTWFTNYGKTIVAGAGQQTNETPAVLFDKEDLEYMYTNVAAALNGLSIDSDQKKTLEYLITSGSYEMTLKNDTNEMNHVRLYDVICRRDQGVDTNSTGNNTPTGAWAEGAYDQAPLQHSVANCTHLGALPFQVQQFTQNYKVIKTTDIIMDPGSIHVHGVKFDANKKWSRVLIESSENTWAWKGFTVFTMVVAQGSPVYVTSGGDGGVSTTPVKLLASIKQQMHYSYRMLPVPRTTFASSLDSGTIVLGQLVDAETGVKEAFTSVP